MAHWEKLEIEGLPLAGPLQQTQTDYLEMSNEVLGNQEGAKDVRNIRG